MEHAKLHIQKLIPRLDKEVCFEGCWDVICNVCYERIHEEGGKWYSHDIIDPNREKVIIRLRTWDKGAQRTTYYMRKVTVYSLPDFKEIQPIRKETTREYTSSFGGQWDYEWIKEYKVRLPVIAIISRAQLENDKVEYWKAVQLITEPIDETEY